MAAAVGLLQNIIHKSICILSIFGIDLRNGYVPVSILDQFFPDLFLFS